MGRSRVRSRLGKKKKRKGYIYFSCAECGGGEKNGFLLPFLQSSFFFPVVISSVCHFQKNKWGCKSYFSFSLSFSVGLPFLLVWSTNSKDCCGGGGELFHLPCATMRKVFYIFRPMSKVRDRTTLSSTSPPKALFGIPMGPEKTNMKEWDLLLLMRQENTSSFSGVCFLCLRRIHGRISSPCDTDDPFFPRLSPIPPPLPASMPTIAVMPYTAQAFMHSAAESHLRMMPA